MLPIVRSVNRRNLQALSLFLLCCSGAAAPLSAGTGTTGYGFLKIDQGARQASLGGAFSGLANDPTALAYNPAGMVSLSVPTVLASYHNYVVDLQSGFLSYVAPNSTGSQAIGFSLTYLDYGTFTETNRDGEILGEFGGSDLMFTAGFARRLSARISAGVAAKVFSEKLQDYSSAALAADIGVRYATDRERYVIGFSLLHVGTELSSLGDVKADLPMTARLGGSYRLRGVKMLLLSDIVVPLDGDPYVAVGAEYFEQKLISFRAGWNTVGGKSRTEDSDDKAAGISLGVGLQPGEQLSISYAFNPAAELGQSHRITLNWFLKVPE